MFLLNMLDVVSTLLCLSTGELFELNPLAYSLSMPTLIILKFGVVAFFVPLTWVSNKIDKRALWIPFTVMLSVYASYVFTVAINLFNYVRVIA